MYLWFQVACMGESQEIPATFTIETGWPGSENCALVTSITMSKEWTLRLRRLPDMRRGVSAVSTGEGWARFMSDHGFGLGALLTFEVVDERRLAVGIHRRSALTEPRSFQHLSEGSRIACGSRVQAENTSSIPDHLCRHSLHLVCGEARPHFHKTLRKTHTTKCASSRMVSRFSNCFQFRQHVSLFTDFVCIYFNAGQEVNFRVGMRSKPVSL